MGLLRKAADRAAASMPEHRKVATVVGLLASTARDAEHPAVAAVVSGLGVAAIVADRMYPAPPETGYAGFTTDREKPKRGWHW